MDTQNRVHSKLLILGISLFIIYIFFRYYIVLVLLPEGTLLPKFVSLRDNILQAGILISAASIILPSAGLSNDESKIIAFLYSITAVIFPLGLYLDASNSTLGIYLSYNSGAIFVVISSILLLYYLGFRSQPFNINDPEKITMTVLAFMLTISMIISIWIFSMTSTGRMISTNIDILNTHLLRYSIWTVLLAFIMKFSKPKERFYRSIIFILIISNLVWTLSFAGYVIEIPVQIVSGIMDAILGVAVIGAMISLLGFVGKRGKLTPHFFIANISIIWLIIAGAIGLYLITFFLYQGQDIPSGWRVFHLINGNWSLIVGFSAIGLSLGHYSRNVGWLATTFFCAGLIKSVITYLLNIYDPSTATTLLNIGEPFIMLGLFIVLLSLIKEKTSE
jgi:hypothetical protein